MYLFNSTFMQTVKPFPDFTDPRTLIPALIMFRSPWIATRANREIFDDSIDDFIDNSPTSCRARPSKLGLIGLP